MIALFASALAAPVDRGLQAEIHAAGFDFVADQLTAAPFDFGPYDVDSSYDCYRQLDVRDFNLQVEIASAVIDLNQGRFSLDVDLGTVRGTDIGVRGVSGYFDVCLDFDATIQYIELVDGHLEGTLEASSGPEGVTLSFVDPPVLTGEFESEIAWFPDDLVWAFFDDLVLQQASELLAGAIPDLLQEPMTGVFDSPFGAFPVELVVSVVDPSPTGLYAAADVDLGGDGDGSSPRLDLGPRADSHFALGVTDGLVRDVVGIAWEQGLLDEDAEVTAGLLSDLVATLGLPADVRTTFAVDGEPAVAIGPQGVALSLPGTTLEAWSGDDRLLRMVVDLDLVLEPDVDAASASILLSAHDIGLTVKELDASGLVADPAGEDHLETFLEGWVADAMTEAVDRVPLFGSRYAAFGYVLRMDDLRLVDEGIATWFTLFDADDPAVDLVPPDTLVAVRQGTVDAVAQLAGVDDRDGPLTWSWRVDGGSWSTWTDQPEVLLAGFAAGSHTVEAMARDDWQNEDPTPALTTFEVQAEPIPETKRGCGCTTGTSSGWLALVLAFRAAAAPRRPRPGPRRS